MSAEREKRLSEKEISYENANAEFASADRVDGHDFSNSNKCVADRFNIRLTAPKATNVTIRARYSIFDTLRIALHNAGNEQPFPPKHIPMKFGLRTQEELETRGRALAQWLKGTFDVYDRLTDVQRKQLNTFIESHTLTIDDSEYPSLD